MNDTLLPVARLSGASSLLLDATVKTTLRLTVAALPAWILRPFAALAILIGAGLAIPVAMLRAAEGNGAPPQAAHVGSNDFSTYCIHDGRSAALVIAYRGDFNSASDNSQNPKSRTWHNAVTLTLKTSDGSKEVAFRRDYTAPEKLTLAGRDYDLRLGRVFLVSDNGQAVRQLAMNPPAIRTHEAANALAREIAALPPQQRQPPSALKPEHESAQALFRQWQHSARTNGKIPGGALRLLADTVASFVRLNPTDQRVAKVRELLKRIDTSRDWTQADAVALLDEVTAVYASLPRWVEIREPRFIGRPIRSGKPLPAELAEAAWGQPAANGLRAAWRLEPVSGQYPLGTNLKARVLFHNNGHQTVVFRTPAWHQYATHKAQDAGGAGINVSSTYWTTLIPLVTVRLAPGEYAEAEAHGIAIGARIQATEPRGGLRVGAWIEAKAGDEVTFQPATVTATEDRWTMAKDRRTPAEMWKAVVQERVQREGPLPASAADREQLIRRVTPDLVGAPPTREEVAAFVADPSPDALDALADRFLARVAPFAGELTAGEIKFRVTAANPAPAKRPHALAESPWRRCSADRSTRRLPRRGESGVAPARRRTAGRRWRGGHRRREVGCDSGASVSRRA